MPRGEPLARVFDIDVYLASAREDGDRPTMAFTGHAPGAIATGVEIEKCNTEPGDSFPDGESGVVIASMSVPRRESVEPFLDPPEFGYYVVFHSLPGVPVFIAGHRIREVTDA